MPFREGTQRSAPGDDRGPREYRTSEACAWPGGLPLPPEVVRRALDQAFDAVVITTAEVDELPGPVIEYVNDAFTSMTGYAADEVVGKTTRVLEGERTDRRTLDELRERLRRGLPFEGQLLSYRKDGSQYWLECRISAVLDPSRRIEHLIWLQRDVSAQKQLADAESQRLLERESEARAHAEAAQAQLQINDQMKDDFLAMLAHELRNPVASIAMAAQLLEAPEGPAAATRARAIIERQTGQLSRLVDDLLDVARVTTGSIELRKQSIDLCKVIAEIVEAHRLAIEARKHRLRALLPSQPLFVFGDAARLAQAVSNLLTNATRYTPDGGEITVVLEHRAPEAVLKVRDTGVGIPKHMLDKIFETFQQVDRGLARVGGGLGLGLTLTRRLVELHGGTIVADSAGLGQGSEFTIRLPEYDVARPLEERPPAARPALAPGLRILVVEDNPDVRDALTMLLSARGHDVRAEEEGQRALEVAAQFEPDLILLDIGLPEMDGYEVARRLRAAGTRARIAALTGYGGEHERGLSREAGFDCHLIKPVAPEALEREIQNARNASANRGPAA